MQIGPAPFHHGRQRARVTVFCETNDILTEYYKKRDSMRKRVIDTVLCSVVSLTQANLTACVEITAPEYVHLIASLLRRH
jgi:hypothetical protein